MLASREIRKPHSLLGYLYEIKLQGERCIAFVDKGKIKLLSRHGTDMTDNFPEIKVTLRDGIDGVILDGEICVLDQNGIPQLELIQSRANIKGKQNIALAAKARPAVLYVFDVLEINYKSVCNLPLRKRKPLLNTTIVPSSRVMILKGIEGMGKELFELAVSKGHEGVMAKKLDSPYLIGKRSDVWQKMKPIQTEDFWVVGLTIGKGERVKTFGALVLAEDTKDGLQYAGTVGSGLTQEDLKTWMKVPEIPPIFETDEKMLRWIIPTKVSITYFDKTNSGALLHPRLRGKNERRK